MTPEQAKERAENIIHRLIEVDEDDLYPQSEAYQADLNFITQALQQAYEDGVKEGCEISSIDNIDAQFHEATKKLGWGSLVWIDPGIDEGTVELGSGGKIVDGEIINLKEDL